MKKLNSGTILHPQLSVNYGFYFRYKPDIARALDKNLALQIHTLDLELFFKISFYKWIELNDKIAFFVVKKWFYGFMKI